MKERLLLMICIFFILPVHATDETMTMAFYNKRIQATKGFLGKLMDQTTIIRSKDRLTIHNCQKKCVEDFYVDIIKPRASSIACTKVYVQCDKKCDSSTHDQH